MGTALTDQQLKEVGRLTKRLSLCFDADAAGQEATLRGMELAAGQGFDIRVVSLPSGTDPADDPAGFEPRLAGAEDYLPYRVRIEIERTLPDRQRAFERVREVLGPFQDSPERQDAVRLAADRLGLPHELQAGLAPAARARTGSISTKALEAGVRLERDALAGVSAHADLVPLLAELTPEHFDLELHRRARDQLVSPGQTDRDLVAFLAELDQRAATEAIDEGTAKELAPPPPRAVDQARAPRLRQPRADHEAPGRPRPASRGRRRDFLATLRPWTIRSSSPAASSAPA